MRLVNVEYGIRLDLLENITQVLYVESSVAFRKITEALWNQEEGRDGSWMLSEDDKTLSIMKKLNIILNPFSIDCNNRKIINCIYSQLSSMATEESMAETAELNGKIISYLESLLQKLSYNLIMKLELDLPSLLKIYDVKVNQEEVELLERLINYINAMHSICGYCIFVFVGIKQYLSEDELRKLYEYAFYNKIYLVLIESLYREALQNEKTIILDKDLCFIEP